VAAELTYIMNSTNLFSAVLFFCGFPSVALHAGPVGTAFLYQGRLIDESKAARDQYDFRSALYDAGTGSNRIGPWVTNAPVAVSKGLFTITLDFGTNIFNGTAYWLEIGVRATGSLSDFTTLAPRQSLAPSPYAHYALKSGGLSGPLPDSQLSPQVARLDLSQTFLGVPLFAPSSGAPFTVGSATKVPNLNADLLDGLDSTAFATALHTHAALDITSGTLDQARLPGNVALREATQTFTGTNIFSHPSNRSARTARTRPGHGPGTARTAKNGARTARTLKTLGRTYRLLLSNHFCTAFPLRTQTSERNARPMLEWLRQGTGVPEFALDRIGGAVLG